MGSPDYKTLKIKAAKYCAYRERAVLEVREKLKTLDATESQVDKLIEELINENFLDEQRFARAFTLDKFRFNKWGKIKIRQQLRQKGVDVNEIERALEAIPSDEYQDMIRQLLQQKHAALKPESQQRIKNQKIVRFMLQKGFEYEVVAENLKLLS